MASLIPGAPPSGFDFGGSWSNGDPFDSSDDVNPLANLTNLVDAMLVLAVGLMVAMVTLLGAHSINVQEIMKEDLTEVANPEEITDDVYATDSPYQEMGKLYMDQETGTTYVIKEDGTTEDSDVNWQDGNANESEGSNGESNNAGSE